METLFRFIVTRPAQQVDAGTTTVEVQPRPDYRKSLDGARASEDPIPALRRVAGTWRNANRAWTLDLLPHHDALLRFVAAISAHKKMSLSQIGGVFSTAFGSTTPAQLVKDETFTDAYGRLGDIILTSALLGEDANVRANDAAQLLRAMAVILRLAAQDKTLEADGAIAAALARTLLLPTTIFPLLGRAAAAAPARPAADDTAAQRKALLAQRAQLQTAFTALTRIAPEHVAPPPAAEMRAAAVVAAAEARGGHASSGLAAARRTPLLVTADAMNAFDRDEQQALEQLKIDPTQQSVTAAVDKLSFELARTETKLANLSTGPALMQRIGSSYFPADSLSGMYGGPPMPGPSYLPTTHGSLTPAGVADLLVVKQFLKRYEAYEESHIENILKGEYKELVHTRTDVTETTTTVEER